MDTNAHSARGASIGRVRSRESSVNFHIVCSLSFVCRPFFIYLVCVLAFMHTRDNPPVAGAETSNVDVSSAEVLEEAESGELVPTYNFGEFKMDESVLDPSA